MGLRWCNLLLNPKLGYLQCELPEMSAILYYSANEASKTAWCWSFLERDKQVGEPYSFGHEVIFLSPVSFME